ncbi:MAG: hypothetical protein WCP12_03470 [bacterium]
MMGILNIGSGKGIRQLLVVPPKSDFSQYSNIPLIHYSNEVESKEFYAGMV